MRAMLTGPRRALLVLLPLLPGWAMAGTDMVPAPTPVAAPAVPPATEVARLRADVATRLAELERRQKVLSGELAKAETERLELELLYRRVEDLEAYRGGQDPAAPAPATVGTERQAEKQAQDEQLPALPRITSEIGGVLTPKGNLVLEPFFQYLYASVNRLSIEGFTILPAILVGVIDVAESDRDSEIVGLNARYGITSRLETEVRVPYVFRKDTVRTRRILDSSVDEDFFEGKANDFGDVEWDIHYQFPRPSPAWPFMVGNFRTRFPTGTDPFELQAETDADGNIVPNDELPTGTGFWAFNPSLTLMYPSDPVVFFGNVGYLYTLEDEKEGAFGKVDPGDAYRMNFGMGLSLNDRASFSLSYSLDLFTESEVEFRDPETEVIQRQFVLGSDVTVGRFLLGFSLRTPNGIPLNLAIGIGATEDAADTDITFRVPFTL